MKLAITAVVRVGSESLVRLHRLEQRKDIIEGPDFVGRLLQGVTVLAMTTDIAHRIDRARAAEGLSKNGRAHVGTPATNAHLVHRLLLDINNTDAATHTIA